MFVALAGDFAYLFATHLVFVVVPCFEHDYKGLIGDIV
jgi:hypothetical protein